jgi:hypothetical protein
MPRILLRLPHDVVPASIEAAEFFAYRERVSVETELLWGNAAFALAANLAAGFAKTGLVSRLSVPKPEAACRTCRLGLPSPIGANLKLSRIAPWIALRALNNSCTDDHG